MNMTKSSLAQITLVLLIVRLTTPCSAVQESQPKESQPKAQPEPLGPGDHTRTLTVGGQERTYICHVPKGYAPQKPMPVVLALHGAAMNGSMMVWFSGLNKKSDEAGFIVVYPSGTGIGPFCTWNAGNFGAKTADDVAFVGKLLDDFASVVSVDEKRVYACGMSNGGMMCYRLAAELSERFIGKSAKNISANDLMWKFFQKHPMKELASAFVATSRRLVGQL